MRTRKLIKVAFHAGLAGIFAFAPTSSVLAQGVKEVSIDLMPIQYAAVKGDVSKFQAITGIKAGAASGINELDIEAKMAKDVHITFNGHIVPKENDDDGVLLITKDNVGYFQVSYKSLRKYYDGTGGWAQLINNSSASPTSYALTQDLKKDVAWFNLEVGNGTPGDSNIWFTYERMTKTGNEDGLSWNSVYESATSGMTKPYKKLAPSLITVDQHTDTLALNEKADLPGRVTVKGKQSYEFVEGVNSRIEQQFTYPGDPTPNSDGKIRQQIDKDQTKLMTSSVRAERWSLNDQTFVSIGYLFAHSRVSQDETLREYSPTWIATGYSNPKLLDGYALSVEDKNTMTAELVTDLTPSLVLKTKFKAELIATRSSSDAYTDTYAAGATAGVVTPHDFSPVYDLQGMTENKVTRTGETVSLRYNAISRTSLFSDLDLEQERDWISQNQYQTNTNTTKIQFEGISNAPKLVSTTGVRFAPFKNVVITSDFKHKDNDRKYNSIFNITPTAEYFFNKLHIITDEFNEKFTWKTFKWMQNAVAFKIANNNYHAQLVGQDWQKSQGTERDINYDLTLQPSDAWMFNVGYSLQMLKASTPAAQQLSTSNINNIYIPPFTGNVFSVMATTSYAPKDSLSLFNTLEYSRAKNANNNESVVGGALLYGVDDMWWSLTTGVHWSPKKNLTITPHYGYYSFRSYQSIETGSYSAHVMMIDVKFDW